MNAKVESKIQNPKSKIEMAAYETRTKLAMPDAVRHAREFFEMKQGLTVQDRLGALYRWRDATGDLVEMRCFPIKGGGTRVEIDTLHHDEIVLQFIRELPRPSVLDDALRRLRGGLDGRRRTKDGRTPHG
ncbi:MAG: hypothetical protein ACRDIB_11345 [Ardenticatenaceae bacterium]